MSSMWIFKMQLNRQIDFPIDHNGNALRAPVVRELFTKRTASSHNLSQLGYYSSGVTIDIKYSRDLMGKTALRLITTSQNVSFGSNASTDPGPRNAPATLDLRELGHGFHYWEGLTGSRYLHSVYSLQDCPELPKANYIMVRKLENGEAIPLFIGQTIADATSLNLAHIRQKAARLGANEIHIHVMTDSHKERADVERDLLKGQFQRIENKLRAQAANGCIETGLMS